MYNEHTYFIILKSRAYKGSIWVQQYYYIESILRMSLVIKDSSLFKLSRCNFV